MNGCRLLTSAAVAALLTLSAGRAGAQDPQAPTQEPRATFKSAVDVVSIAATVRDRHGRFARDLKQDDFLVLEGTEARPIIEFHAAPDAPVRVALLFDVSGSMRLGARVEEARQSARHVIGALRLNGGNDEAAVFSFDMNLQSLQPFTADSSAIETALSRVEPYGQTSLYDAIAQTARRVADTSPGDRHRRAVIVFTDGVDTSSEMTPAQVSSIASDIDVPVYVITIASDLDQNEGGEAGAQYRHGAPEGKLRTLARWTGGELFVVSAPAHQSVAARQLVDELRHQYVLGVSASAASRNGWHPLTVRVRNRDLTVRARSGYTAGVRGSSSN